LNAELAAYNSSALTAMLQTAVANLWESVMLLLMQTAHDKIMTSQWQMVKHAIRFLNIFSKRLDPVEY